MKRGFKNWAEKKSLEFRKKLLLKHYDKLPAVDLADYLNVKLIEPNKISGLQSKDKLLLLNHDHSSWSAITIQNYAGKYLVIYNSSHSIRRQESDLMHELSHIICKHTMEKIIVRKNFPFPLRDYDEIQEDEAKWLGGCLQLPRNGLVWAKYKKMTNNEIAEHFGASLAMLKFRLNVTGVDRQFKK